MHWNLTSNLLSEGLPLWEQLIFLTVSDDSDAASPSQHLGIAKGLVDPSSIFMAKFQIYLFNKCSSWRIEWTDI